MAASLRVWERNYLRALITRQASISPSSSSTRAQQPLAWGEQAEVWREVAVGLAPLHTQGWETEFPLGRAREGTEHAGTDGPRRQRAARGRAGLLLSQAPAAEQAPQLAGAVASRKSAQGGFFPAA